MKEFFKNLGTGLIFFLLSGCAMCFGSVIYFGITAIPNCSGWEAIGLAITCILIGFMIVFIIHCMGVIPNDTIARLERKISELAEEDI